MKGKICGLDGTVVEEITLPPLFQEHYRPDIIKRAVDIIRANRRQPYGTSVLAGKQHAVESWHPGRGVSRVPRLRGGRRAAFMPGTVGGRQAHPPKTEKQWKKKINKKEMRLARTSALSAVADATLVRARGHVFDDTVSLPLIMTDELETIAKTRDILTVMKHIGVYEDLMRAKHGKHIRAGKGTRRGRKYKVPKSVLFVVHEKDNIKKAAGNLQGVDIVTPRELNVEHLAPGGDAGRLTIFTRPALQALQEALS
jgi:large subunit ribosomal protein L4e